MIAAALMALALTGSPLSAHDRAAMQAKLEPQLSAALRPLAAPYRRAMAEAKPSVEAVRTHLEAVRALETAARPLLDQPATRSALLLAWTHLGDLESALAIEGEGRDPATRAAVRSVAQQRADDAYAIARDEMPSTPAPIAKVAPRRMPALQACWQAYLLGSGTTAPLDLTATLTLSGDRFRRVTAIDLAPALKGPRAYLGQCLEMRLLGWVVTDDAEVVELPLRFVFVGK